MQNWNFGCKGSIYRTFPNFYGSFCNIPLNCMTTCMCLVQVGYARPRVLVPPQYVKGCIPFAMSKSIMVNKDYQAHDESKVWEGTCGYYIMWSKSAKSASSGI